MKAIELALNVCTVMGMLLVAFAVLFAGMVVKEMVKIKRGN